MADTSGMLDIRGINIDKAAKGFADEESIFKKYVTNSTTNAWEIRWYQKTSGFLDSTDTTGITASAIQNTSFSSRPVVVEQSWTRKTSYIKKFFVESPWISDEDMQGSDIDIIGTNIRDLVRAVANQVDIRIWNVMVEANTAGVPTPVTINNVAIVNEWDDYSNATPIADLMQAKAYIRSYGYNPEGAVLFLNSNEHMYLMNWLISTKGSSIPAFASERIKDGVVMEILGLRLIISQNVTVDYGCIWVPQRAGTWKSFKQITAGKIVDLGIGTKIRVWEEGECLLTDSRAVCLLSNVGPT